MVWFPAAEDPSATSPRDQPFDVYRGGNVIRWLGPEQITYTAGRGLTDVLVKQDIKSNATEVLTERISNAASFSTSGDTAIYLKTSARPPPGDLHSRRERRTPANSPPGGCKRTPAVRSERVSWKSTDGLPIEGILWLPINYQPGQRVPLLVELHGGPTGIVLDAFRSRVRIRLKYSCKTGSPSSRRISEVPSITALSSRRRVRNRKASAIIRT